MKAMLFKLLRNFVSVFVWSPKYTVVFIPNE